MWRRGYISDQYEDDALSGCYVNDEDDEGDDDEECGVCGMSGSVEGEVVKNYLESEFLEIILQFTEKNYESINTFRLCPDSGKA